MVYNSGIKVKKELKVISLEIKDKVSLQKIKA